MFTECFLQVRAAEVEEAVAALEGVTLSATAWGKQVQIHNEH
jgi:hypothetical protein